MILDTCVFLMYAVVLQKVLDVLREHANAVRAKPQLREISVRNNRTAHNPLQELQKIYRNPDRYAQYVILTGLCVLFNLPLIIE